MNKALSIAGVQPLYIANFVKCGPDLTDQLWVDLPWEQRETARREVFYNSRGTDYTYGSGKGQRTYTPVPEDHPSPAGALVDWVKAKVSLKLFPDFETPGFTTPFEACFINGYEGKLNSLGWHADDSPTINHDHPIAIVSFGAVREIWYREKNDGLIFMQKLGHGSLFVMPPGFQQTHEHRIPKADREVGPRISLTFRSLL